MDKPLLKEKTKSEGLVLQNVVIRWQLLKNTSGINIKTGKQTKGTEEKT